MSDTTKLRERVVAAMERITSGHGAMRVPADPTDPDLVLCDILAHLDGEPERQAAKAEEVRETCARRVEASFAPGCWPAAEVRAVPLDSTPLEDEIRALRADLARVSEELGLPPSMGPAPGVLRRMLDRADAAEARVRELEAERDAARAELTHERANGPTVEEWRRVTAERDEAWKKVDEWRERAQKAQAERNKAEAERDELRRRIHDACPSPDEGGRIHAGSRIVCGQCHDSEVRHLTNERDALRAQVERLTSAVPGLAESGPYTTADVERIEAHRGRPYARLRATVGQVERVREVLAGNKEDIDRCGRGFPGTWHDGFESACDAVSDALEGK